MILDTFKKFGFIWTSFLHKYLKEFFSQFNFLLLKIINNLTTLKPQTKNTLNKNKEFNATLVTT